MKLLPESLFGRLMTALLGVVGATVLIIAFLIVRERQEVAFRGSATAQIVEVIAQKSMELASLSPAARVAAVAQLREESLPVDGSAEPRPPPQQNLGAVARVLRNRLARQLDRGYGIEVRPAGPDGRSAIRVGTESSRGAFGGRDGPGREPFERDGGFGGGPPPAEQSADAGPSRGERFGGGRQFDIAVSLPDGDQITFRTGVPRAERALPRQIFVELALLTAVLAGVLYLMTRNITQPLSDLARSAEAFGRGARHLPLRETGARELREATRAFNTMQERLHRYLDSRTQVLAAMSHDLRTPLTRLKLRAESLDDETQRERFVADLDEMNSMVTGALNLFRGLNNDEPARPVQIEALLAELRAEFAEVGATVEIFGAAPQSIAAKPQALKRCLTNLLSNAIKYGTRATVMIEDGSALVLRVLDEGPGIPPQALEQVFEPFFRLESSRNADTGGTGLGLSIARDIAQAHGGSLVLRNRSPSGLEAVLTLPRAQ